MTEPTITSTIESMFDASRRLRARDHSSTTFAFGEHVVEMATAHHHNVNGISLDGAFHLAPQSEREPFRLTVIDDGQLAPGQVVVQAGPSGARVDLDGAIAEIAAALAAFYDLLPAERRYG